MSNQKDQNIAQDLDAAKQLSKTLQESLETAREPRRVLSDINWTSQKLPDWEEEEEALRRDARHIEGR